jgi:hypothetical protein
MAQALILAPSADNHLHSVVILIVFSRNNGDDTTYCGDCGEWLWMCRTIKFFHTLLSWASNPIATFSSHSLQNILLFNMKFASISYLAALLLPSLVTAQLSGTVGPTTTRAAKRATKVCNVLNYGGVASKTSVSLFLGAIFLLWIKTCEICAGSCFESRLLIRHCHNSRLYLIRQYWFQYFDR